MPPGVATVLSVLRSSAVVVDDNDVVLKASAPAYALGLVRGTALVSDELADLVRQVRRDGQIRETEMLMSRRGIPARHVTARVAPLGSRLVLALVEDRTRERRVEAVRRDFVANVSHELKTPVGAIRLLAEAVHDAADDPEAVRRFAGRMHLESDRLSRLVQQVIELSRLQGDDPLEAPMPVSVDEVVAVAVDTSAIDADSKRISIVTDGTPGLEVLGNREQVTVAVANLVANAVSYSGCDSTVLVTVKADDGQRRDLRHRPGHRHPRARDRPHLRAVLPGRPGPPPLHRRHRARPVHRQARRRHPRRGRPGVVGGGPGFDVHPDPSAARPGDTRDQTARQRPGGRPVTRVLVVEDEESYSDALAYMLRKEGFEVAIAADGQRRPHRVRPHRRGHRAARPDAARHPRHRGVPADPADLQRPGDHGQRQGRRGRQGGRARARRRRLRHQALLAARAGGPDPRGAAPRRRGRRSGRRRPSRPARSGWTSSGTW